MDPKEKAKPEYGLYKGRILSTLCDSAVKRKQWSEAETICQEVIDCFQLSFANQEEQLHTNLGIQYYQLAVIKRSLKKLEEAIHCTRNAYEHIVQSKLKPEFS